MANTLEGYDESYTIISFNPHTCPMRHIQFCVYELISLMKQNFHLQGENVIKWSQCILHPGLVQGHYGSKTLLSALLTIPGNYKMLQGGWQKQALLLALSQHQVLSLGLRSFLSCISSSLVLILIYRKGRGSSRISRVVPLCLFLLSGPLSCELKAGTISTFFAEEEMEAQKNAVCVLEVVDQGIIEFRERVLRSATHPLSPKLRVRAA